jgi:hypothetical protein
MLITFPRCVARFHDTMKMDTTAYTMFGQPHLVLDRYATTKTVSGQSLTSETGIQTQNDPCVNCGQQSGKEKLFLFSQNLLSPLPVTFHPSFTHYNRCIILATNSVFNTLDTSLLDRWAADLKFMLRSNMSLPGVVSV